MVASVSLANVHKVYDNVAVVNNLSLTIEPGEIFGLLGPNGAGKSTTIRMLTTLTQPSQGDVVVAGYDVCRQRREVRQQIGVVLQQADIAHGSFNGYSEVIRRNDAAIGELVNAIKGDEGLRDSTSVFVLPEFGRDSDLNTRRGLDHGDGSDDLRFVHGVAWGPDFKRGKGVTDDRRTIDVMPTVAHMFGADARYSKGSVLKESFA